jgi:hypothetical protein
LGDELADDFSWVAEIPALIQTAGTIGTTAVSLREQQIQNQRQDTAQSQQTAALNAQTAALEQAQAANAAAADPSSPAAAAGNLPPGMAPAPRGGKKSAMSVPLIIGGSVIALALVVALVKLRRG